MTKLLVVDDDPDDIELMKSVIDQCTDPVHVVDLPDGSYVMDYLHSCTTDVLPDLIILDLNMPRKNGFDVLREVKAEQKYNSIPIFILTTGSAPREKAKALELGAFDFLTKPPGYEEWVQKLCGLMEERQRM